ncbi:MAG: flavodoxin family protein [Oscillospiraceae bacterium]|nr:flavodoxin family protein [Oscillospiraceae bacterium]
MKIIGINGSPRKNGNSAAMLEAALAGAREQRAETERIDLFDLDYSGCHSCFACKRLGGESYGRCAQRDALTEVLDKVLDADALILSAPLYFGEMPGAVRNFLERLWFPAQQYAKNYASAYKKRVKVGLIYTMNLPSEAMYQDVITRHKQNFGMLLGKTEVVTAVDTLQYDDYSLYASELFDGEAKKLRHETVFPEDCAKAFEMGKRLAKN